MTILDEQLVAHGVDIAHHFGGGVYAKETHIPAGVVLTQHSHAHAHLSILATGRVILEAAGTRREYEAPACLTIPAGIKHSVTASTAATWYCIHATEETDPRMIDEVLTDG